MPERVQLKRTKGWRLPENTVKVARPGLWGNPFVVTRKRRPGLRMNGQYFAVPNAEEAVACYREMFNQPGETADALRKHLPDLRGKNLACFCALDQPCHADVLLELANAPALSSTQEVEP